MDQQCLFGPKFLEKLVGRNILSDPKIAVVELIANAWDAGATQVDIVWPANNEQKFSIRDNGDGLSKDEFSARWRTLAYDRIASQGSSIIVDKKPRSVFGRNGVGRFAGFCFGESYFVESTKAAGKTILFEVKIGAGDAPFVIEEKEAEQKNEKGTRIYVLTGAPIKIPEEIIRAEIGMRFLTDPSFSCIVNGTKIDFSSIPSSNTLNTELEISQGRKIKIQVIDTMESDKTTKQHGIAWHVNGRLVGESNWKDYGFDEVIDGRSAEAKRHTFIITANFLSSSVNQDWTEFNQTDDFKETRDAVFSFVKHHILGQTKEKREKTIENIKATHQKSVGNLTPLRAERWESLISTVQEECPSITEKDLSKLAGVLASMEQSESKFDLINKLHELNPGQIDDLHKILCNWSLDFAKEVLDELEIRLRLLDELKEKVFDTKTREVQDLQPIFHQGLWIFGPEYETIEYTSNEGMTKVIQKLFDSSETASRNRPDFAILPDSTVGSYSYPTYDEYGGEIGVDRVVIVELKKPGVPISTDEKAQCWRYVSELLKKGVIQRDTKVTCFVLGSEVDPIERDARKDNDRCIIQPMDYQAVIQRAKSRLLKLYDRVKDAPFLEQQRQSFPTDHAQNVIEFRPSGN